MCQKLAKLPDDARSRSELWSGTRLLQSRLGLCIWMPVMRYDKPGSTIQCNGCDECRPEAVTGAACEPCLSKVGFWLLIQPLFGGNDVYRPAAAEHLENQIFETQAASTSQEKEFRATLARKHGQDILSLERKYCQQYV